MKKLQLVFVSDKGENQAGTKAPRDVSIIAEKNGFERVKVSTAYKKYSGLRKIWYSLISILDWFILLVKVSPRSVILIQCPMEGGKQLRNTVLRFLRVIKQVKYIALVHDVMLLRYKTPQRSDLQEYNLMLDISDVIIVHNEKMKQWFLAQGISSDRLLVLNIFDYLIEKKNGKSHFEKSVSIAGNLDLKKSKYLTRLKDLQTKFVLYGPNYNEQIAFSNITYKGSYSPEELPEHLNRGFGLIWDGESIDTCSGDYGNYLKYNNPHKLSLYIACGMPVFIWHEAAEASLVVDNNLGYTISNLNDIDSIFAKISEEEYSRLVNNVSVFSSKLVSGSNTKLALEKAMYKISRKK